MNPKKIIVASHGTEGSKAAESLALELATEKGAAIHHLLVVPDFWKGMMGDDWLNNAVTQARFGDYVENQLAREAAEEIARFEEPVTAAGIKHSFSVIFGKPALRLLEACAKEGGDMVVIGSPRPKGVEGYRSRMNLDDLTRGLKVPLLIAPWPAND